MNYRQQTLEITLNAVFCHSSDSHNSAAIMIFDIFFVLETKNSNLYNIFIRHPIPSIIFTTYAHNGQQFKSFSGLAIRCIFALKCPDHCN